MFNTIFLWNDYNLATKMIIIYFQMLTNFTTPLIGSFRALWKWNDSSCSPVPSRFLHFMKEMFHRFFRVFKLMLISGVIILAVNPVRMQTPVRTSELFGDWNLLMTLVIFSSNLVRQKTFGRRCSVIWYSLLLNPCCVASSTSLRPWTLHFP